MLQTGIVPDDETYNLVVDLLIKGSRVDSAFKYLDIMLKSGYAISSPVYAEYVGVCVRSGRLDTLAYIIEKCKVLIRKNSICYSLVLYYRLSHSLDVYQLH
jgi:pentatricopeptide repeat protein